MLLLAATNDKLQVVTSAAVTVDVHASYMDHTLSSDNVEGGKDNTAISTATTTDIVDAPASGVIRNVKTLHITNTHATDPVDVHVVNDVGGTDTRVSPKPTLLPGEQLAYIEGIGWFVVVLARKAFYNRRVSGADVVNATTSFADVTGLTCPVESGKFYAFQAHLYHITNATTTGARFAVNGPAATALRVNGWGTVTGSATAEALSGPTAAVTAYDTAATGTQTTGPATEVLAIMSGYVNPSASGTFAVRCQSEVAVASGLTVKVGSWLQLFELDN